MIWSSLARNRSLWPVSRRSFGRMKAPVAALKAARESRPGGRINLQESQSTTAATRQIRLLHASKNLQQVRGLGVLHGRLVSLQGTASSVAPPHQCTSASSPVHEREGLRRQTGVAALWKQPF